LEGNFAVTISDINVHENRIFTLYKDHCPLCQDGKALPDGTPDPSTYLASDFKAIFVLKEAYGWERSAEEAGYPRDLRQLARDGGSYKTWANLARWCSLIQNPNFALADMDATDHAERAKALAYGCFVNLKKLPGKTRSNSNEIAKFAKHHSTLLKSQFALYKPTVTLACGTFRALRDIYGKTQRAAPEIEDGFVFFEDSDLGIVIDFYHPQYLAISSQEYLDMLRSNLRHHFPARYGKGKSKTITSAAK